MGMTVTAISMMTVPATVGVMTRLRSESRDASRNWNSDDATISVASSAGPPYSSAATDTAMKTPDVPMSRTYPAPIPADRPRLHQCRDAANQQRRERGPGQVGLAAAAGAHHDRHRDDDPRDVEQDVLETPARTIRGSWGSRRPW